MQTDADLRGLPGKDREKIEKALYLCRVNGAIPADFLQVGLAILRGLGLENPVDGKQPFFWTYLGFVEWINACSPEEEVIQGIFRDLRTIYPSSSQSVNRLSSIRLVTMSSLDFDLGSFYFLDEIIINDASRSIKVFLFALAIFEILLYN